MLSQLRREHAIEGQSMAAQSVGRQANRGQGTAAQSTEGQVPTFSAMHLKCEVGSSKAHGLPAHRPYAFQH